MPMRQFESSPRPVRPSLGFMLPDGEMLSRLAFLYGRERVDALGKAWASLRERGFGDRVDAQKERYCRRMYNLSQCLKTIKENASMWYNETYRHEGCLWQGRFYSGVVERSREVLAVVAAYVAYNPVKAKIAPTPADWRWSSYAQAVGDVGSDGQRSRAMYERMFGCPWAEVRGILEAAFADKLPADVTAEQVKEWFDDYDEESCGGNRTCPVPVFRATQAIRVTMKVFSTGAYIGRDFVFYKTVRSLLPDRFPCAGKRAIKRCRAFLWELPNAA